MFAFNYSTYPTPVYLYKIHHILAPSTGAVDLRNEVATFFSLDLPATTSFDHPTIESLAEFVTAELRDAGRSQPGWLQPEQALVGEDMTGVTLASLEEETEVISSPEEEEEMMLAIEEAPLMLIEPDLSLNLTSRRPTVGILSVATLLPKDPQQGHTSSASSMALASHLTSPAT